MHQIVHGDSMQKLRKIEDGSAKLIMADPPYGIAYTSQLGQSVINDKRPYIWWLAEAHRVCMNGGGILCFTRWDVQEIFKVALESAGFTIRSQVVWDKGGNGMGDCKTQFSPRHELIWWATKGRFSFPGPRPLSLIHVPKPQGKHRTHPTEKPVDLMVQLIEATTKHGDLVVDPFPGTGAAGVACVKTGRRYFGSEIDGKHARIARERIAAARGS